MVFIFKSRLTRVFSRNRFSGLNIMLVTMASRVVTLMLSLVEDLELENVPHEGSSFDKGHAINYLLISSQCTGWQRIQWLLARNNVPKQLWKLFCSSYSMVFSFFLFQIKRFTYNHLRKKRLCSVYHIQEMDYIIW